MKFQVQRGDRMEITYLEAIHQALWEEMDRDERVFMLGEDIGVYGGAFKVTKGFLDKFGPERVIDTPLSESAFVGAGIGAASWGCDRSSRCSFPTSSPAPSIRL